MDNDIPGVDIILLLIRWALLVRHHRTQERQTILRSMPPNDILCHMNSHIYQELEQLTVAQRRSLGEALISSAESEASAPLISEKQRSELRNRLSHHRAHPDEPGISFADLKAKLLTSS